MSGLLAGHCCVGVCERRQSSDGIRATYERWGQIARSASPRRANRLPPRCAILWGSSYLILEQGAGGVPWRRDEIDERDGTRLNSRQLPRVGRRK